MTRKPDPAKRQQRAERLQRFRRAGQTVTQFCEAEGVSQPAFYQWQKRLGGAAMRRRSAHRPQRKRASHVSAPAFQPVWLAAAAQPAGATIRFPNGVALELGTDLRTIEQVVRQLLDHQLAEGADAC